MVSTVNSSHQTLQEFFDSPAAMGARHKLSASAAEPVSQKELLALEPGAADTLIQLGLDYPQRYGAIELREKISGKYEGINCDDVVITSGVDEALGLLFVSSVQAGDRVVVLTPCYPPHLELPKWRGATIIPWQAREANNWIPDLDELAKLLQEPTRMVIATFPQNPTGFMPDETYIDSFLQILRKNNTLLLADEIYAGLPISNEKLPTLANRYERAVSLHGLSKTCGLPGLRIGWLASRDKNTLAAVKKAKNLFNCYLPVPIEFLAGVALRHEQALLERNNAILTNSVAAANSFFKRHDNLFAWMPPQAGVVAFPRWLGPGGTKELSDRLLRQASIALAPSLCFDAGDNHFRFGLCRRNFPVALGCLDEFLASEI